MLALQSGEVNYSLMCSSRTNVVVVVVKGKLFLLGFGHIQRLAHVASKRCVSIICGLLYMNARGQSLSFSEIRYCVTSRPE